MLHVAASAPASRLPAERRGRVVGRFCRDCYSVYPLYAPRHAGKPAAGPDHVASTCVHEGREFAPEAEWWEPAVEILPQEAAAAAG